MFSQRTHQSHKKWSLSLVSFSLLLPPLQLVLLYRRTRLNQRASAFCLALELPVRLGTLMDTIIHGGRTVPLKPPIPTVVVASIVSAGQVTTVTSSVEKDGTQAPMAGEIIALSERYDSLLELEWSSTAVPSSLTGTATFPSTAGQKTLS